MDVTYSKALAVIEDINRLFLSLEEDNSKSSVQKEGMKNESTIIAEISASLATLQKHHKDLTFLMGREMMGTKKDIAKGFSFFLLFFDSSIYHLLTSYFLIQKSC